MLRLEQIYFSLHCKGNRTTHTHATWVLWMPIKMGNLSGKECHWSEERFSSSLRLANVFSLHASDRIQFGTIKEHYPVCMCVRKWICGCDLMARGKKCECKRAKRNTRTIGVLVCACAGIADRERNSLWHFFVTNLKAVVVCVMSVRS